MMFAIHGADVFMLLSVRGAETLNSVIFTEETGSHCNYCEQTELRGHK